MYNIYFVGLCAWLLFYGNHGIERINMYLTCFIPVILSAACYYFYQNRKKQIYSFALFGVIALLLLRTLYEMYSSAMSDMDFINYKTVFNNFNFIY